MGIINFTKNWILRGLIWGSLMFLTMSIIFPSLERDQLDIIHIMKSLTVWLVMGIVYGYVMNLIERRK